MSSFMRLFFPAMMIIVIFSAAIYGAVIPLISKISRHQKEEQCRSLVNIVIAGLGIYNEGTASTGMNRHDSIEKAAAIIRVLRFGDRQEDYFWIMDHNLRLIVHPDRNDLESVDPDKVLAPDGQKLGTILRKLRDAASDPSGGFAEYDWSLKDDQTRLRKKISFAREFKPWGWIIGTGIYLDDIEEGISEWKKKSVIITSAMTVVAVLFSLILSIRVVWHEKRELDALKKLSESEKKFRSIFDLSPFSIAITGMNDAKYIAVNPAFEKMSGYTEAEIIGKNSFELGMVPDSMERRRLSTLLQESGSLRNYEVALKNRAGEDRVLVVSTETIMIEGVSTPCALSMSIDITENHRLRETNDELRAIIQRRTGDLIKLDLELKTKSAEIENIESRLLLAEGVLDNVSESVVITDPEGKIVSVNNAFTLINGYTKEEAISKNPRILKSDRHGRDFYADMWNGLLGHHHWTGEIWNRRKSGEAYPGILSITAITGDHGEVTHYIGVTRDMTELHRSRDELNYNVMHDVLTGLPNRHLFTDRLSMACPKAKAAGGKVSVLMIGLDRFSGINKALGFPAGDILLQETGSRLKEFFMEMGSIARFGGDEFIGMIAYNDDIIHAVRIAEDILSTIGKPLQLGDDTVYITASIGVATFPQDGSEPVELIRNASIAMDRSKAEGKNRYSLFTMAMNDLILDRIRLETDLRAGIDLNEFTLHYQPKIDSLTGKIKGMESLMRWTKGEEGPVSPAVFIPLAEETGEIIRLGELALKMSCMMNSELASQGHNLKVAVNVSPKQFFSKDLMTMVEKAINISGLPPSLLELEITESTVMQDIRTAIKIMNKLRSAGVTFSLDDFGTGYSSLSHIKNLPLSGVKIDKSFIDDIAVSAETRGIIKALSMMSLDLKLDLTIEGIETAEQLEVIKSLAPGVLIQGYYYSKPLPPADFIRYIKGQAGEG